MRVLTFRWWVVMYKRSLNIHCELGSAQVKYFVYTCKGDGPVNDG